MTSDTMEIVNPVTTGLKAFVDSSNRIHDLHDCVFAGDHSNGLDENDKCTICGKTLGDFIAEDSLNPTEHRIPIILVPSEDINGNVTSSS